MKNWRTTIIGCGMAVLLAIQPLVDFAQGNEINWMQVGFAALIAIFGYLSKDAGVSGKEI